MIIKCDFNHCLYNIKGNCIGGYADIEKYKKDDYCGYFAKKFDSKGNLVRQNHKKQK